MHGNLDASEEETNFPSFHLLFIYSFILLIIVIFTILEGRRRDGKWTRLCTLL
ncbi:hypothetical protein BDZ91DRAFT_714553 [Kalaharituber pfeilii]|nr:hypothetical protein BDZ91DRAFT_714553 [Kalaharituber pfeilii]